MTRERAAELLGDVTVLDDPEMAEAHRVAISALRQQEHFRDLTKKVGPLTMDELRKMDGEPVWLVNQNGGRWVIMSGAYLCDSRKNADYGKTWLAYRQKPEEGTV